MILLVWIGMLSLWCISEDEMVGVWTALAVVLSVVFGWRMGVRLGLKGIDLPEGARPGSLSSATSAALMFPAPLIIIAVLVFTHGHGLDATAVLVTGGSQRLLRLLGLLVPAPPHVVDLVQELAGRSGVIVKRVSTLHMTMANAVALNWTREMAFTPLAIQTLSRDELASVAGHELAHLRESIGTRLSRLTGIVSLVAIGLLPSAIREGKIWIPMVMWLGSWFVGNYAARLHKKLEVQADLAASGAEEAPGAYARALEKIHAVSLIPAVFRKATVYPHLYDRMLEAGVTPDFVRPRPPGVWASIVMAVVGTVMFYAIWFGLSTLARSVWNHYLPDWGA